MWGVACSMAETQGLRKLSVAETLAQATSALEAHRVWMRRRMSTAVAPSSESQLEEDTDHDPAQDHNLGAKHAWEHVAGHSTAGNTESDFLETESPSELSKPRSAPPPSAQQWLETLKRRRIASNKIAPIAETGSTDSVNSQQSFDRLRDVWKGHQSPREEETEFDHTPLSGVQIVLEPTRGKLKRKRRLKASIVPSEDVSSSPPTAKRLTSTSDVFISPTPYHAEPVVTLNAWGSVPTLDKRSDSAADVHQSSNSDEELSPELSTTTEDDLVHQDEAISNGAEISGSPDNVSVSTSQHPQCLKAASTGRIIPVDPAPKDQRSSYDFQKQSKLSAADAAGEILDITASEMARTGSDLPGVRLSSARQRAVADVQDMAETKLQSVLPNAKGTRNSVFLSHPASQHNEDTDSSRMEVEFKGKSSKSLSEIQGNTDASLLDSSQPRNQQDLSIQKPVFEEATIPSSTEVNVAPSAKNTVRKNTRDSLLESGRDIMKELDRSPLKPLRLEEVIGGSDVLRRLPPATLQSPQSPLDVSLSRKRRREPPSYSIHQSQLQASVLAPPCPAFGVEQPTETEVLRSISKKQAASTPGSTPNTTAMTPPASAAGSMEQTSALSRSALLRPLSAVKSVFSGAMFNRTETTKTDVAADGSFRTQSILVAQDCQDIEQLEEEEEEEEGGTAEGPTSYSQPAVQQTGAAEASLAVDAISMCELPPGPGPLHMAAKAGNLRRVQTLLRQGHDVDTPDHEGRTPLMYCIHSLGVHLSCADALIKEGANLNKQSSDGSTAMHLAASVGAVSLIELMILNGASAKIRDFDGRLPLHWATTPKTTKSIALLMKYYSVDVNTTDDAGMTPLMWAAYNSNLTVTAYLLEQGADCEEKDKDGYTAMHWAIHKDSTLCLQLLLKPDMTYFKDSRGRTVMHMAAELGAMAACDVILKLRLDALHDTDKKDRTPLHYAAACSRVDVCALLLDRGADATQKDSAHKTALDYARSKKLDYVVALLTCHGTAVADFARASKSTSVSSFLSHAVSFTALAEDTSREERSDTTSHRSVLSGRSSRVAPAAEGGGDTASVLSWSQTGLSTGLLGGEEDISIYGDLDGDESFDGLVTSGGLLGRFTTDKHDPVQHFYFWLKPKTNSICWAREHNRKFAKEAKVLEIHEGPSNTVKLSPIYSPSDLHRYVFWVATAVGVLDLFAYNQEAYLNWIKAINKLAQRNTEDESNLKESLSRSRPASWYTLRSTNSVAPMNTLRPESPELPRQTSPVSNGSTAASDPVAGAAATSGHSAGHQQGKSAVGMFITSTPIPTAATSALHTSSAVGDTSPTRIPQMPVQFLDDVI